MFIPGNFENTKRLGRSIVLLFEVLETPSKLSDFKKQLSRKVRCLPLETLETLNKRLGGGIVFLFELLFIKILRFNLFEYRFYLK